MLAMAEINYTRLATNVKERTYASIADQSAEFLKMYKNIIENFSPENNLNKLENSR